jgi:hypothetical protein
VFSDKAMGSSVWMRAGRMRMMRAQNPGQSAHSGASHAKIDTPPILDDLQKPFFSRWQRFIRLTTVVSTVGMTWYLMFYHDFGEKEHCFSPVCATAGTETGGGNARPTHDVNAVQLRREYARHMQRISTLTEKDVKEIEAERKAQSGRT